MRLLTSKQMQEADQRTISEIGIPGLVLMENAGGGVARTLWELFPDLAQRPVLVLAGSGNNGGDGLVIARHLFQAEVAVRVVLLGRGEQLKGDAKTNYEIYCKLGGWIHESDQQIATVNHLLSHASIIVDAVFGTGLARPVTDHLADLFRLINRSGKTVVAVDIPSGVSADSGAILGEAIRAQWTITFASEKIGHRQHPGAAWCGTVLTLPIGIPAQLINQPEHTVAHNLPTGLTVPKRQADGHKGRFGHVLIVAGSRGKTGAAVLAALGAHRVGPGLVTVATPEAEQPLVAAQLIESMTLPLPAGVEAMRQALRDSGVVPDALAVGPGLGQGAWVAPLLFALAAEYKAPLLLDADALNVLALEEPNAVARLTSNRSAPTAITPHPGEMARLLGCSIAQVQTERLTCALNTARAWRCWVVLKGAGTVVAAPDGRAWINSTGNSGLASGGSGDLLSGMIVGLLAQGWEMESALRAAVWMHGAAADQAAQEQGEAGLLATDLLPFVRRLRNEHW